MSDKPNVFNIPANYHFFKSLLFWCEKNFAEKISEIKIFLPNRRSCRELREIFIANHCGFVPQIKAISDLSFEDFFDFLPHDETKEIIAQLLEMQVLSNSDYLFFLSREISKYHEFGENLDFEQAFKIALNLQNLFDEVEREEIDLSKLSEIDDSNLSKHRLITLDFLKNFHVHIKNSLLKQNVFFATSAQNHIFGKFSFLLEKFGSKTPIVIAGSTGSVSFSARLIKAIAQKNYVILHGASDDNFDEENHPQFFLNRLIKLLAIDKKNLSQIAEPQFLLSCKSRQKLISLLMLPEKETLKWQTISNHLDVAAIQKDLAQNFSLIETNNQIEEAKIINLALQEATQKQQNCALITNNDQLAKLVKLELEKAQLSFNDVRNLNIFDSKLINFLLQILEVQQNDFDSHTLLALFKNPLCRYAKNQKLLADFEINILRQQRYTTGLEGILLKSKEHPLLQKFCSDFCGDLIDNKKNSLTSLIADLIASAQNLSGKTWLELLANESAQIEIFEFFEQLKTQQDVTVKRANSLNCFKILLSQISYFEKSDSLAPIQILTTIEARLLNYDLVIIASLNEGSFPEISGENWLGKKIKKDLGIDRGLKKFGQSAYDFCNYLSNSSVMITRCKSNDGAALIESPFLLKFKTVCQKAQATIDKKPHYFLQLAAKNQVASKKAATSNPRPQITVRPQKFSITEIAKLLTNPYDIYAKKILGLEKLQELDFEGGYAEFGSFVHKALEEFVKNPQTANFLPKAAQIFQDYFSAQEARLIWWPKFENIFADFEIKNLPFLKLENRVEIGAEIKIGEVLLRGKIDRIVTDLEGNCQIFDYKTGSVPEKKDVTSGKNPQLTIAALMLLQEISQNKITELNYWKLSSSSSSEINKICDNEEQILILAAAAKAGLEKLFAYFADEKNGYLATENSSYSDYTNLSRIEESNK